MADLNGRSVLIVGGSSRIGLATAVAGRAANRLPAAVATIGVAGTIMLDVADEDGVRTALSAAGPFDHVVVMAGRIAPSPDTHLANAGSRPNSEAPTVSRPSHGSPSVDL